MTLLTSIPSLTLKLTNTLTSNTSFCFFLNHTNLKLYDVFSFARFFPRVPLESISLFSCCVIFPSVNIWGFLYPAHRELVPCSWLLRDCLLHLSLAHACCVFQSRIAGSCGMSIFSFNDPVSFLQSECVNLHTHRCRRVSFAPHPCQRLVLSIFLKFKLLSGCVVMWTSNLVSKYVSEFCEPFWQITPTQGGGVSLEPPVYSWLVRTTGAGLNLRLAMVGRWEERQTCTTGPQT